jgi:hypothetical protein
MIANWIGFVFFFGKSFWTGRNNAPKCPSRSDSVMFSVLEKPHVPNIRAKFFGTLSSTLFRKRYSNVPKLFRFCHFRVQRTRKPHAPNIRAKFARHSFRNTAPERLERPERCSSVPNRSDSVIFVFSVLENPHVPNIRSKFARHIFQEHCSGMAGTAGTMLQCAQIVPILSLSCSVSSKTSVYRKSGQNWLGTFLGTLLRNNVPAYPNRSNSIVFVLSVLENPLGQKNSAQNHRES